MSDPPYSQVDPALLELFQAEMDTHIPVLNEGLLALEKGEAGAREIEGMMRAAHSIKGAARIVGIHLAVKTAHVMEDCFTAAKEGRISFSSEAVDILLHGVDALQRICGAKAEASVTEASLAGLLGQLAELKDGRTSAQLPATQPAVIAAAVQPEESNVLLPAMFDDVSAEALRETLMGELGRLPGKISLDFVQVGDLGAAGLALLASFQNEVSTALAPPVIEARRINPSVKAVLRVAGLDTAFGLGN
jgi:two-component system sensor histidine kinase and response regulator WspE